MNKKIVLYAPKIKSCLFIQTLYIEEINSRAKYINVKNARYVINKKLCVKGQYREIHIEKREHLRQQIRERLNSAEGKLKYLKRMRIESVFGNIKHNLNYIHLYLKGIKKNNSRMAINLHRT